MNVIARSRNAATRQSLIGMFIEIATPPAAARNDITYYA
jgi:hypothetical protein